MDREKLKATLDAIGITKEGAVVDDMYIITLDNSDEYSRMYTKLDKNEDAILDPEGMIMSDSNSIMTYLTPDYDITLKADFDKDKYYVVVEEAK